jgi:outer membrane PBP1 activator LpoA protein
MRISWSALVALAGCMGVIVGAHGQALQPDFEPDTLPGTAWTLPAPDAPVAIPGRIGVLLPLSGRQQALGMAVRDGFIAAMLADPAARGASVEFIDDAGGAAAAYAAARAAGAAVIVGPLLKDGVEALAPLAGDLPVLALNFLGGDRAGPPGFYQFGLAPEDETAAIAARTLAEGRRRAIALAPDNEWGRRLINAFNAGFSAGGGQLVGWEFYDPAAADFSVPVRTVLGAAEGAARKQKLQANLGQPLEFEPRPRADVDFIFVAANAGAARLIRPALRFFGAGDLPAYGTSALYDDGTAADADMDGMLFPDSPWVIAPDSRASTVKNALRASAGGANPALARLYALGYDACALGVRLASGALPVDGYAGVTGLLTVDDRGRVHRDLSWARLEGGTPAPLTDNLLPAAPPGTVLP